MTKLPNCPRCGDDELWRVPETGVRLRCYECGWDSQVFLQRTGESVDDTIARAIKAYVDKKGQAA